MADSGNVIAKAYVAIIPEMEGSQKSIANQLTDSTESASKEAGEKSGKSFGESLAKGIKAATAVIGGAIASATGTAVTLGKKFIETAKATAEMGDTIDKASARVGFAKKSWQEWDYVLKLAGSDMQSASAGIKTMANQVEKAKAGNKEAIANFKALGISVKDLKSMGREEIFAKLIEQFQKMPESTKRASLATKLLGRAGQELTPLFNQSAESTKNLIDKANQLGIVMSDKDVKASANFKDSLTTLNATVTGLKNSFVAQFLPSLSSVADGLAMVFGAKTDKDRQEGIKTLEYGISELVKKLQEITPKLVELGGKIISSLIQGIAPMLPSLIQALFSLLSQALSTMLTLLPQLMPSIVSAVTSFVGMLVQILPILIDAVMRILTALAQWLGTPENARLIANGIVQMITSIANTLSETLPIILPAIVTLITEIAKCLTEEQNLRLILTAVWEIIKAVAIAIGKSVPILLEALGTVVGNLFTAAVDYVAEWIEFWVNEFKRGWTMFTDWIANCGKSIVNFFTNIKNKVVEFFTNIKNKVSEFIGGIKQFFADGFNKIKEGVQSALEKVKGFFSDMLQNLRELPKKALDAGKNIVSGIIDGVKSMVKKAVDAVKNLGKNMMDGIKGFFKIKSPSRLMRDQVGRMLGLGISEGFSDSVPEVVGDMKSSLKGITDDMGALTGNLTASVNANATATPMNGTQAVNSGTITMNIYGAEGQNINDLANVIAYKLEEMTKRKGAVYA